MNNQGPVFHHTTAAVLTGPLREDFRTSTPQRSVFDDQFVEQFERHFERVRRVISRLSGEPELADDITQDTFIRLYRRGALPDSPGQWLIAVALNLFRNSATSRRRRSTLLTVTRGEAVHSDPAPAPDQSIDADEARTRVRAATNLLPERERQMLLLRADGYSYRDIATTLDINEASVGTLLARAKRLFLEAYGDSSDAR